MPYDAGSDEVGAFDAKTHLSALLDRVGRGERITITRRGVVVAVLVPPGQEARHQTERVIARLDALRARTRPGGEALVDLRDHGRRR